MMAIAEFMPHVKLNLTLISAILVIVVSNALTPLWFFQGLQRMSIIGIVVLFSRIFSVLLTYVLVRSSADMALALWSQSLGTALACLFCLWYAARLLSVLDAQNYRVTWKGIREELLDGWHIFQSMFFSALLTNTGVLILGLYAAPSVVGGYAVVERVGKGVASLLTPFTQAIYPRISAAFARSTVEGLRMVGTWAKRLAFPTLGLVFMLILIHYSGTIGIVFGSEYQVYSDALLILIPWILLGVVNNFLGIQIMTNIGEQAWYSKAFTVSALVSIAISFMFSGIYSYRAIAAALVLGETSLTLLLIYRLRTVFLAKKEGYKI